MELVRVIKNSSREEINNRCKRKIKVWRIRKWKCCGNRGVFEINMLVFNFIL